MSELPRTATGILSVVRFNLKHWNIETFSLTTDCSVTYVIHARYDFRPSRTGSCWYLFRSAATGKIRVVTARMQRSLAGVKDPLNADALIVRIRAPALLGALEFERYPIRNLTNWSSHQMRQCPFYHSRRLCRTMDPTLYGVNLEFFTIQFTMRSWLFSVNYAIFQDWRMTDAVCSKRPCPS